MSELDRHILVIPYRVLEWQHILFYHVPNACFKIEDVIIVDARWLVVIELRISGNSQLFLICDTLSHDLETYRITPTRIG